MEPLPRPPAHAPSPCHEVSLLLLHSGGPYDPMLLDTPFGRSRSDVAGFILQGTVNAVLGESFLRRDMREVRGEPAG